MVAITLGRATLALPFSIASVSEGASWSGEVARWQRDHGYALRSWPASWLVDLSDRDRPCSPLGKTPASVGEPHYCEGAWLQQINANFAEVRADAARRLR